MLHKNIIAQYLFLLPIAFFIPTVVLGTESPTAPWVGSTLDGLPCTGSAYYPTGPYDYTQRYKLQNQLQMVEGSHFRPDIENLIEGKHRSSDSPEPDLAYTLKAWPNHPRALLTVIRFQLLVNKKLIKHKLPIPAECYLQRAINFSKNDPAPYSLYAFYLTKVNHANESEKYYIKALELSPNNAKIEYSYANLLITLKRPNEAVEYAKKAYMHGRPPNSLKNKLIKLGVWN